MKKKSFSNLIQTKLNFNENLNRYLIVPGGIVRVGIIPFKGNDPNRELMIKFKHDISTYEDEKKLHENIKKLIFKAMHSNYVRMDFDDVYQEIWKKIIRSKRTWNENKGTRVSTWIVCVANSVINTLRQNQIKYNSRYCLYDDIKEEDSDSETFDILSLSSKEDNSTVNNLSFKENFKDFINSLTFNEKELLNILFQISEEKMNKQKKYNGKISTNEIQKKLNVSRDSIDELLSCMKKKFYQNFEVYKAVQS